MTEFIQVSGKYLGELNHVGYHSLLAGLGRISGVVGQRVLAGEPVGDMGDPDGGEPRLYIELRRDGQPINPSPWLAMLKSEEDG